MLLHRRDCEEVIRKNDDNFFNNYFALLSALDGLILTTKHAKGREEKLTRNYIDVRQSFLGERLTLEFYSCHEWFFDREQTGLVVARLILNESFEHYRIFRRYLIDYDCRIDNRVFFI